MIVEIPLEEEAEMLRDAIVALLSRDPNCPFAQILGQRLMDVQIELYEQS